VDLRIGGDQVVHVISQNLALTQSARRYEARTGKPVLFPLARVKDPDQRDRSWLEDKVHNAAPKDAAVQRLVGRLLADATPWSATSATPALRESQVRQFALGYLADQALQRHWISEVTDISLHTLALDKARDAMVYRVAGSVLTRGKLLGLAHHRSAIAGYLHCRFDRFGRISAARFERRI
jgi:hypothetical protein